MALGRLVLRSEDSAISSVTHKSFRITIAHPILSLRSFSRISEGGLIEIPGTDRNEPLWDDYCDEGSAAKWGVEGFSEVLSREVAPLGVKVTIVEPGGFRTDFAGSSTELAKVILNTIRRLELPQDFSGTTTASSLVTPKRQLRRSSS